MCPSLLEPNAPTAGRLNVDEGALEISSVVGFEQCLNHLTGLGGHLGDRTALALEAVIAKLGPTEVATGDARRKFYGLMNQKLMSSRDILTELYAFAASHGTTFNYPTKQMVAWAVDSGDRELFEQLVTGISDDSPSLADGLLLRYRPLTHATTRDLIVAETRKPTKLRKALNRTVIDDVFESCAGPLVWSLWPEDRLHTHFLDGRRATYTGDYMRDLRCDQPALFDRSRALSAVQVDVHGPYMHTRKELCARVAAEYSKLDNYGYLALLIPTENASKAWRLAADITLYAERFLERPLAKQYFRFQQVARETTTHIQDLDVAAARFELVNEGFTYRDTFALTETSGIVTRLLLIFQKNERDETPVPCPACRSLDVRGNSYPALGVKSWECVNPLCTDRSIYNRGKRYSFKSLLAQAAIEHDENEIPIDSVRQWQRDVLPDPGDEAIREMLIRHYSMAGDGVAFDGWDTPQSLLGRSIAPSLHPPCTAARDFWSDSAFVRRYAPSQQHSRRPAKRKLPSADHTVIPGDAAEELARLPENSFDAAVTSPPYFNAREYAQWKNLYTYLYDMWQINAEVLRVLKPGAVYAYNLFDYFDNDRTVTFSAMGQKRLPLTATMVDVFTRIGFEVGGAAVWDKGEIHGKRGFNAGNFSPFYQSPFNCWEHVLLLRKPSEPGSEPESVTIANQCLRIHPVVKQIGGKNVFGHTAPYPVELAERCLSHVQPGGLVIDPFGGSGTTARAAINLGLRSVLVERDPEYVELSRRLNSEHLDERRSRDARLF